MNRLGILSTKSVIMLTDRSQNDLKCVEGSCVEGPSNHITNEQIQISCLVLFFIPHNEIHTTWQCNYYTYVSENWLCWKMFSAAHVRHCNSMGIFMGIQPWHTCIRTAAKTAHTRPPFWTHPETEDFKSKITWYILGKKVRWQISRYWCVEQAKVFQLLLFRVFVSHFSCRKCLNAYYLHAHFINFYLHLNLFYRKWEKKCRLLNILPTMACQAVNKYIYLNNTDHVELKWFFELKRNAQ